MTPEEMLDASGTNWEVYKAPLYTESRSGKRVEVVDSSALLRSSDDAVLDIVGGEDWLSIQNAEAFAFFKEYCEKGQMEMETAGSLRGGRIVWVLARLKEKFELFGGDVVQGNLLFTNYHMYGQSRDVRFTPIRVVCANTLSAALAGKTDKVFRATHRVKVDAETIKQTLGMVQKGMGQFKELASYLGSKEYTDDSLIEFFSMVFPTNSIKEGAASRNAMKALEIVNTQPGTEYARNTWWQAVNAVTYMTDHELGRTDDTRVYNALYGNMRDLKIRSVKMAMEFAKNS
jgi:phage/plasmid-like protein (TIGR03299 family)